LLKFTPPLHGLRGIAALGVLLFHWDEFFPALSALARSLTIAGTQWNFGMQLRFGWLGVHLFFVLSGYLLASQLAGKELSTGEVMRFWRRRVLRIYPGAWLQLAVIAALAAAGFAIFPDFSPGQLLLNFLLWINMPPAMAPPINGVYWTLPIELCFYLALPFIVGIQRRIGWRLTFAIGLAIALGWRVAVMWSFRGEDLLPRLPILDALPGTLASFMAGVAISNLSQEIGLPRRRALLAVLAAAFVAMQYWLFANLDTYWKGHWMLAVWTPAMAVIIALGVHSLLRPPPELGFLGSRPFVWLGDVSYGIYLWHLPVIILVKRAMGEHASTPLGSFLALPAALAATLVLAAASYYLVERPAIRWGRRMDRRAAGPDRGREA
jgi:peptidoglycan/LPS O-acetylase OafA/YrhL